MTCLDCQEVQKKTGSTHSLCHEHSRVDNLSDELDREISFLTRKMVTVRETIRILVEALKTAAASIHDGDILAHLQIRMAIKRASADRHG